MRTHKLRKKLMIMAVFMGIFFTSIPMNTVYAATMTYDSWVQDTPQYDSVYGTENKTPARTWTERNNDETVGFAEFFFSSIIEGIGVSLDFLLNGDENFKADIDTIIRGRLKQNVRINLYSFELVDNNPFGIIGAKVYKYSRIAFFPFMIIVFCVMAIKWLLDTDKAKGMLDIKQGIQWTVAMVLWMYMFPMITDWILYFKDAYIKFVGDGLLNGETFDIVQQFYDYHFQTYTIVSALLYVGALVGGIFYLSNYIGTAMTQTFLFGIMPLVSVLSVRFRKLFSNVTATFIPNLFIPAVDFSFLLMPILYGKIVQNIIAGFGTPMLGQLVQLFMIWGIIPARQAVFRAFGVMAGAGNPGGGFGGMLGTMAMMARSMARGGGKSPSGNGNQGNASSSVEDRNSARYHEQLDKTLQKDPRYPQDDVDTNRAAHERLEQMTSAPERENLELDTSMNSSGMEEGSESINHGTAADTDFDAPLQTEPLGLGDDYSADSQSSVPMENQDGVGRISTDAISDNFDAISSQNGNSNNMDSIIADDNGPRESGNASVFGENTDASLNNTALPRREENLSTMQEAQVDYDTAADVYHREQSALNDARSQLRQNERELDNINREAAAGNASFADGGYNYTPEQKARVEHLQAENKKLSSDIRSHESSMGTAQTQMSQASGRLRNSQRIEQGYADFDRVSGGTGKNYTNVGDFQLDNSLKEAQKKFINHRNFDSKQFAGVLTNEEKAKYYKQRAMITDAQTAVSFAGKLAQGAATAAAVAGATYGGPNAMVQSGMIAYSTGGYVADKAVEGVNSAIDHIPQTAQAVKGGAEVVASKYNEVTDRIASSVNTRPVKDSAAPSKNASYYKGQVLANEQPESLKQQAEAVKRGGKMTNET